MAAESTNRRGVKPSGLLVRPQAVSDKSYMESVVGFINDVVPQAYSGTTKQDDKETVLWAKFEQSDINDYKYFTEAQQNGNMPPLLLVLGFTNGIQVWTVPANGDAQEVLSWRQGPVRSLKILHTPPLNGAIDEFSSKRPLVALCDSSSAGQQFCSINIVSLSSGDQVHCIRFQEQILDLNSNKRVLVVTFHQKIAIFDTCSFKEKFTIIGCFPSPSSTTNPIALGPRWLAFADKKLYTAHQTCGGMTGDGVQSYTATVIHAAKTITKGLTIFGETVASSLTGHKNSVSSGGHSRKDNKQNDSFQPGIVTIVDILKIGKGDLRIDEDMDGEGIVAHFPAHTNEAIQAMAFDPSGMLLLTACTLGNNFHIFGIFSHPTSPSLGAVHHLYTLHRGDTTAKVQDIAFSLDTRWVAVTTHRGTTHIFPITQYGGPVSVRTHLSPRVVNRYSRFQKSAGLEDIQQPSSTGRNSPVLSGSPGSSGMVPSRSYDTHPSLPYHTTLLGRMGNPRLPPYPHPTTVLPLAQLKQPLSISVPGISNSSGPKSPTSKGRRSSTGGQTNENINVVAVFAPPRAWLVGSPSLNREKREKRAMDSLFVMGCHGNLIEYILDPKPAAGFTKANEDAPIELEVTAYAQWNLARPITSLDIKLPLTSSNPLIVANQFMKSLDRCRESKHSSFPLDQVNELRTDSLEDNWLSQVEIITHAGPHRRLWMGPQFSFKTIQHLPNTTVVSSTSSALLSQNDDSSGPSSLDMFAEELDLQSLSIRPARSNPVAMAPGYHSAASSESPLLIEASSGSFERTQGALEVIECGSLVNVPFIPPVVEKEVSVDHLKETIADAMIDLPNREFDGDLMGHQDE